MNTPGAGTIAELKAALAAAGRREVLLAAEVASLRATLEQVVVQNDDSTALVCASKHGHTATALVLLAAGADKEATNTTLGVIEAMPFSYLTSTPFTPKGQTEGRLARGKTAL